MAKSTKPSGSGGSRKPSKAARKKGSQSNVIATSTSQQPSTPSSVPALESPFSVATAALIEPLIASVANRLPVETIRRVAGLGPPLASTIRALLPLVPTDLLSTRVSAVVPTLLDQLQRLPIHVEAAMDPRLQLAVINRLTGKRGLALTSTSGEEVAVVGRVSDVDAWTDIEDVIPGATLGEAPDGTWIVTGRLAIDRVEHVRTRDAVISLKASQPLRPSLAYTMSGMELLPGQLPAGVDPAGGEGTIVGIVDFGCDFCHSNFRQPDGSTRLLAIWNQGAVAQPGSPYNYGRLYTAEMINAALGRPDPYAALGYGPRPDAPGESGSHGTHVMDIATGNGSGSGQSGVAPLADIIFVEAASTDIPWDGPQVVNRSFGDSVQLLEAVRFIFDQAGDRPCVVNLSLGTNGGPHDGSSLVEQGLDALVREKPNRAVVIAASNSQTDGIHIDGTVGATDPFDIVVNQQNAGGGEIELWYPGNRQLEATLVAADGTAFGPVMPGNALPIGSGNQVSIFISSRLDDPNNRDNVVAIWIAQGLSEGSWTVRLRSLDGEPVAFHAWIERDDATQASFAGAVNTHTLGSISTGHNSIVVGSYDAHKPKFPLSSFSSSGPTRDGRFKPEVSAPGQAVMAARSRTGNGVVRKSGTSMAAPAVTGLVSLIYAQALRSGQSLDIATLRDRLTVTADARGTAPWDARYGYGRVRGKAISP